VNVIMMKHTAVAALLFVGCASAIAAAPIYRCGADRNVYSQKPCAEGRLIDAADPRSAAQRAEANQVAGRERKLANDLARERRAQEAAQASAAGIDARPVRAEAAAAAARAKGKKRSAKPKPGGEDFVAVVPGGKHKGSGK
jgi:hypothetical protein